MKVIDAVGKACPMPVIMAKKEIDGGADEFLITIDNQIAVENLKRLAKSQGFEVTVQQKEETYQVIFAKSCEQCEDLLQEYEKEQEQTETKTKYVVFVGKEYIGDGDLTLGRSLMQMFFYTLSQSEDLPKSIVFMNGGVKLPVEEEQCVEHLQVLKEKGVNLLVCGTCLNFYGIAEQLKIGTISNMYDIVSEMQNAGKVITV